MSEEKELTREEYAEMMREKRKELNQKADRETLIVTGDKEAFLSWLQLHSRLNYSVFNSLLVHNQNKQAIELMESRRWNKLGCHVRQEESGVQILLPDGAFVRSDGSSGPRYRIITVFDVTQTNATAKEEKYDHNEIQTILVANNEKDYEGRNLGGCIDLYVSRAGKDLDPFCQDCVGYLLKARYGVEPNTLNTDPVTYFKGLIDPMEIRAILKGADQLYRTTVRRIERGLYLNRKREVEHGKKLPAPAR